MGQSYSADSPLLGRDTPLTTAEAEANANHIVDHLQSSRQKALLALFQCASDEYTKEHSELVESGEITADINNCDTFLSSIAASRFALSDAIDEFPTTQQSDPSLNVFADLDNETQVINNTPIGFLGFHSSIDLTPNAFISDSVGDQRVWFKALQTGQVYVGPAAGGHWYNSDAIGRSHRNGAANQLLREHTTKSADVEALLKLALRGKKNSFDFLTNRNEQDKQTNPYYYSPTRQLEGETWEVFDHEPLAAQYAENQLPRMLQTTPSLTYGLAAYLAGIYLCNNNDDGQRRYSRSSYYKLTNAVKYNNDTWTMVSESEILIKEQVHANTTKCAFAIPPSRLLALLPNLSAQFLEQSVKKCRNDVAKIVEEDLATQSASRLSSIRAGRVMKNDLPPTSKFSQRSAADIIAATKRESQLLLGIYENSPPGTFPGIELLTHHYTADSFAQTSPRMAIQYKINLPEYLRGIRATSGTLHAMRFSNHWIGRFGHLRPHESESACLLGPCFAKKLFRRYFLSNGGHHLLPIDELHDFFLCENTMDDLMWLVQREPAALSSLRNAAAAALLRATNPDPRTNRSSEDVKHLMILEEENYAHVMAADIACGHDNGEFPVSVFEAWVDDKNNDNNNDQEEEEEEEENNNNKEDEIDVNDGIVRLQRRLPQNNEINHLTFFKEHHRLNPGRPCFTSREDFLQKWNKYTHGILDGFYSPYAWVIGGAVVASLDPTTTLDSMGSSAKRDIDICFAGLSHAGVLRHIQLFDSFMRNKFAVGNSTSARLGCVSQENWPFPHNMVTCSTSSTLTYVLPHPLPRVQIILGRWPSVGHLLRYTDVDCSGVALSLSQFHYLDDNEQEDRARKDTKTLLEPRVVLTPRSLHAWLYRISVPSSEAHGIRGSISYESRMFRYALRDGFAVVHFDLGQKTLAKLKDLELGERIRMTMTSGATWLYFVDSGQFKPKMDAPSVLDVSPTRGLSQVRDQIVEQGIAEVPGIASAMFRNKEAEDVGLLNKYAHLDTIWARNDVNRGGTIIETCTSGSQVGITSADSNTARYRARNGENQLRSERLWYLTIGHEHSVDTDSWTVDLDRTGNGKNSDPTDEDPEDVVEQGDDL